MENWYYLYLAHFAYLLSFISFSIRNITWLRVSAILASCLAIYYSSIIDNEPLWVPILWNSAFVIVNAMQLLLSLWRQRNVSLDPIEKFLSETILGNFPPAEVKSFVKIATEGTLGTKEMLIEANTEIGHLYCILNGKVDIYNLGKKIAELGPGRFVGEMSLLTKAKTRADVVSASDLRLLVWSHDDIGRWVDTDTARLAMLQTSLGTQIVEQLLNNSVQEEKIA